MKLFAVTLLIVIVYFAFVSRVSAQCIDYASCVGERAEIDARLRPWARETAEAKAEERRAVATQRAYDRAVQQTATEAARPTKTPVPTVTTQPSATSAPTVTPHTVIVQVVVTQPPAVATPAPMVAEAKPKSNTAGYIVVFGSLALIVAGIYILLRGRTVFYPHEPS